MIALIDKSQIITLHIQGRSNTDIALALGIHRNTVSKYVNELELTVCLEFGSICIEIELRPEFQSSLTPLEATGFEAEPIRRMLEAARVAGTGPMAAVAGTVSALVGEALAEHGAEAIVENGGDIFLVGSTPRTVAISAGESPFSGKIGLAVDPIGGVGVCTSSGTYGHSLSFGKSDAAVVVAADCALADATATMLGNKCQSANDLQSAVEWAVSLPGVDGALAIMGDRMAAAGDIELARLY